MTPKYTASAMVEIRREGNDFTNIEGAEPQATTSVDQEFYQTQYGLLQSRALAERVATELQLFDNAAFFDEFNAPGTSPVSSPIFTRSTISCGNTLLAASGCASVLPSVTASRQPTKRARDGIRPSPHFIVSGEAIKPRCAPRR